MIEKNIHFAYTNCVHNTLLIYTDINNVRIKVYTTWNKELDS